LPLSTNIPVYIGLHCGDNPYGAGADAYCTSQTVRIVWASSAFAAPGPFNYHVVRDGQELKNCITANLYCTDTAPPGSHYYRVYSVDPNNIASPLSAAAVAVVPATTNRKADETRSFLFPGPLTR